MMGVSELVARLFTSFVNIVTIELIVVAYQESTDLYFSCSEGALVYLAEVSSRNSKQTASQNFALFVLNLTLDVATDFEYHYVYYTYP